MRDLMIAIVLDIYKAMIIVSSAILCCSGAFAGAIAGTVYALGWPMSVPNLQVALIYAPIFALMGCGATTFIALSVRPKLAVVSLGTGAVLTTLISGLAAIVLLSWGAAC